MFLIVILCFSQSNAFPQLIFAFDFGIFFCCKLFLKRKRKKILHSNMCNFGKIMKQIFFPYTAHIKPSFLLRFQKVSQATMKTIKVISRVSHLPDDQEPKCSISSKSQPNILLKAGRGTGMGFYCGSEMGLRLVSARKLHTPLLLILLWPEVRNMASPNCKGGYKAQALLHIIACPVQHQSSVTTSLGRTDKNQSLIHP